MARGRTREHEQAPQPAEGAAGASGGAAAPDLAAAPTDYARHIWLLVLIVAVVLVAWAADRVARSLGLCPRPAPAAQGHRASATAGRRRASPLPFLGEGGTSLLLAPARDVAGLTARDRVVGVFAGDGARAYPVRLLQVHGAVLDRIDGKGILVCWSNLTQLATCFELPRGNEGRWRRARALYRGNMMLLDEASGSLWDGYSGRAIAGPRVGEALPKLPVAVCPWPLWRQTHPDSLVLRLESGLPRLRARGAYSDAALRTVTRYLADPHMPFPKAAEAEGYETLPPKSFVLGIVRGEQAKAYPLDGLLEAGLATLTDEVAGKRFVINVTSPMTASATDGEGRPVAADLMLWFGWIWAHPGSAVWSP